MTKKAVDSQDVDVERRHPRVLLVGMWNGAATLENSLAVSQKVNHRVPMWPSNSTAKYIAKRNENIYIIKTCTGMFTTVLLILAKRWKQHKCTSTDEWINQVRSTEYSSAIRRIGVLIHVTHMDEPWKHYSKSGVPNSWATDQYWSMTS